MVLHAAGTCFDLSGPIVRTETEAETAGEEEAAAGMIYVTPCNLFVYTDVVTELVRRSNLLDDVASTGTCGCFLLVVT